MQKWNKEFDVEDIGTNCFYIVLVDEVCDNNFDWAIGIRLDSGKCVRYEGSGVEGVPIVEQMTTFCRTLWDRYAENVKR